MSNKNQPKKTHRGTTPQAAQFKQDKSEQNYYTVSMDKMQAKNYFFQTFFRWQKLRQVAIL
jgi:hypothetical protein